MQMRALQLQERLQPRLLGSWVLRPSQACNSSGFCYISTFCSSRQREYELRTATRPIAAKGTADGHCGGYHARVGIPDGREAEAIICIQHAHWGKHNAEA